MCINSEYIKIIKISPGYAFGYTPENGYPQFEILADDTKNVREAISIKTMLYISSKRGNKSLKNKAENIENRQAIRNFLENKD